MSTADIDESMRRCFPDDGTMDDSHHAHVQSRPAEWEQAAVRVVAEATEYFDTHAVHLSDAVGCLPIIEKARKRNGIARSSTDGGGRPRRRLTVESCPHYLLLDSSQIDDGDTRVKCFPPIRNKEQRLALWDGLLSGAIDMIASDHSPCEPSMRRRVEECMGWLIRAAIPATRHMDGRPARESRQRDKGGRYGTMVEPQPRKTRGSVLRPRKYRTRKVCRLRPLGYGILR